MEGGVWKLAEHALNGWDNDGNNKDTDPLFVGSGYELADHSPAIDQGDNDVWLPAPESTALYPDLRDITVDLLNQTRIVGPAVDLGAYENQSESSADAPPAPHAVLAKVLSDTSAHVTIQMPPETSDPVSEYVVVVWEEGVREVRRLHTNTDTVTVENLQTGVGYTFTVIAINDHGISEASAHSNYIFMQIDDTPPYWLDGQTLQFEHIGENEFALAWPAAQDDQAVQHYYIYVDDQLQETVTGSVYEHRVSGLSPGTEYTFAVYAVDTAGNVAVDPLQGTAKTLGMPDDEPGDGKEEEDDDDRDGEDGENGSGDEEGGSDEEQDEETPSKSRGRTIRLPSEDKDHPAEEDTLLQSLVVIVGGQPMPLHPAFAPDIGTYRVTTDQALVVIEALPHDEEADLWIDGERSEGRTEIHLKWGETRVLLEIRVGTDQVQTYTLVLVRQPELNLLPFTDLAETHWSYDAVQYVHSLGIIQGYPDDTFRTERPITRAEFIVMLMNMQKLLDQSPAASGSTQPSFTDQDAIGAWAWPAIEQALNEAIVYGYEDGTFRPQVPIQRSEMIAMLARTPMFQSVLREHAGREHTPFQDTADIPHWAEEAVADAQRSGMIHGRDGHLFAPSASATRGEIAVLMHNFFSNVIESAAYKEDE